MSDNVVAKKRQFVEALVSGVEVGAAARACDRSPRTGYRWLATDPMVQDLLRECQGRILRELTTGLLAKAQEGVKVLGQILISDAPPYVKAQVASKCIDSALKLLEYSELSQRVEALEQAVHSESRSSGRPVGTGYGRYR